MMLAPRMLEGSRWWEQRAAILAICCVVWVGCARRTNYHVVQQNAGSMELGDVRIRFDGFDTLPTILLPKTEKAILFVGDQYPLPEKAEVSWTAPDGRKVVRIVGVKAGVPPRARLVAIVFSIDDQCDVHVKVKPAD